MLRAFLLASAALAVSTPAFALMELPVCEGEKTDPRMRCPPYSTTEVYRLPVRVGSHVVLIFAEDSVVLDPAGAMLEAMPKGDGDDRRKPKEWVGVWEENTLNLQVLNSDLPSTVMTVPVRMRNGKVLYHAFQLDARDDNRGRGNRLYTEADIERLVAAAVAGIPEDKPDLRAGAAGSERAWLRTANTETVVMVRFSYTPQQDPAPPPPPRAPVPQATIEAQQTQRAMARSRDIAGTLAQEAFYGNQARNWSYIVQGETHQDPEISDNGLQTVMRFDPVLPIPKVYKTENDQCEGAEHEQLVTSDGTLGPGIMRIRGTYSVLCLRHGTQKAARVVNCRRLPLECNLPAEYGQMPWGANPRTGTISPNVVRTIRGPRN